MYVPPFVHLHCHSHYSLLDGANRIHRLVDRTKKQGMNALALTDHGNLYGALEFYHNACDAGINPIVGYEAYVAPGSRCQKTPAPCGGRLPSHAAGPEQHRLSKPGQHGLGRVPGRFLFHSPHRQGTARSTQPVIFAFLRCVRRIQPDDPQATWLSAQHAEATDVAEWFAAPSATRYLHRDSKQRARNPTKRAEAPSTWPAAWAFRSSPSRRPLRQPRGCRAKTCCSASIPANSASTTSGCVWKGTGSYRRPPKCTPLFPDMRRLAPTPGDCRPRGHPTRFGATAFPRLYTSPAGEHAPRLSARIVRQRACDERYADEPKHWVDGEACSGCRRTPRLRVAASTSWAFPTTS